MGIQERKWFQKAQKEKIEHNQEAQKKVWCNQPQPAQPTAQPLSPTVVVNHHRMIKLRKFWLIFMFLVGIFFSYVMAIYLPDVWNQVYYMMQRFLP